MIWSDRKWQKPKGPLRLGGAAGNPAACKPNVSSALAVRSFSLYTVLFLGLALVLLAPCELFAKSDDTNAAPKRRSYILATATTGGTFYPVGVALATLTKVKLEPETGISLSAISSAGSAENIKLLRTGEAGFAIVQGLYAAWGWTGTGRLERFGKQPHLRSLTRLWDNVEHFLVRAEHVNSGSIEDLRSWSGQKFSIGKRNSGAEGSNTYLLTALGITLGDQLSPVYQGYGPSADSLQDGRISGMSTPAGPPVTAVTRVMAARGNSVRLLNFNQSHLARINRQFPLWSLRTIPAGTYPGQTQDISSIAHPNVLVARADVDDEVAYQITRAIYQNLDFLANIHQAVRQLSVHTATTGLPAPLHPGAIRFYREQGLEIPAELLPPDANAPANADRLE